MTPTCTAQMQTDWRLSGRAIDTGRNHHGFTLVESMVVVVIASLLVTMTMMNFTGMLRRNTFRAQVHQFVSTMQMAATAAAQSDRRYEVIIDIAEQCYTLRQVTSPDLSEVLEEDIIVENDFSDNCRVAYVLFDDATTTGQEDEEGILTLKALFRAGHAGWQYGGKIILLDEDEQPYSVIVNRMNRIVTLKEGDVEILMPKSSDELPF